MLTQMLHQYKKGIITDANMLGTKEIIIKKI